MSTLTQRRSRAVAEWDETHQAIGPGPNEVAQAEGGSRSTRPLINE